MDEAENPQTPPDGQQSPAFHIEQLYLKDLSFESPNTPEMFRETGEPQMELHLETSTVQKGPEHYETILHVIVKMHLGENKVLFLVDVTFAGLFLLRGIPKEHLSPVLGIECPNILFPYVRRIVAEQVGNGGFKPVHLDPINFAALYQQQIQQQQSRDAAATRN